MPVLGTGLHPPRPRRRLVQRARSPVGCARGGEAPRLVLIAAPDGFGKTTLVSLINDLDVLAGPTVVALDDHDVIDGAAVHEALTFLLDSLPPQVALALTTRADPPLPLSRLRARRAS